MIVGSYIISIVSIFQTINNG